MKNDNVYTLLVQELETYKTIKVHTFSELEYLAIHANSLMDASDFNELIENGSFRFPEYNIRYSLFKTELDI